VILCIDLVLIAVDSCSAIESGWEIAAMRGADWRRRQDVSMSD
jgi:hypothetical protein